MTLHGECAQLSDNGRGRIHEAIPAYGSLARRWPSNNRRMAVDQLTSLGTGDFDTIQENQALVLLDAEVAQRAVLKSSGAEALGTGSSSTKASVEVCSSVKLR